MNTLAWAMQWFLMHAMPVHVHKLHFPKTCTDTECANGPQTLLQVLRRDVCNLLVAVSKRTHY